MTSQTFFSADFPQRLFNFNRSTNPFDAVRQIHQSVDEFMNRTARAFFADFEELSGTAYHRSPAVRSGNDAPVPFHQNRQQWYELNVTRPSERLPPPSASAKRSIDVLDQLPVSVVRVKSATNNSANASKQSTLCSKPSGAITISDANELNVLNCGEGKETNAHEPDQAEFVLKLDRRRDRSMHQLFPINQLRPTAAGGRPECEICLTGLDDVPNGTSPRVTICGSGSRQLHPFPSPTTETKYRRSKNHLHVLTDSVEPGFELTPSSTPPMGQRCRIEGSNTELLRWATKNMPEPPQSSFLDGLSYPCDVVAASADCLI
ncbi:hypothetical protein SprV_0100122000 [Sparganum proliferum]